MEAKISSAILAALKHKEPILFNSKVSEELAELSVAYAHYVTNKAIPKEVIEEVADVIIQLNKVMWLVEKEEPNAYRVLRTILADKIEYLENLVEEK